MVCLMIRATLYVNLDISTTCCRFSSGYGCYHPRSQSSPAIIECDVTRRGHRELRAIALCPKPQAASSVRWRREYRLGDETGFLLVVYHYQWHRDC